MHSGGIRGEIIRYKKDPHDKSESLIPLDFKSIHANEGIKIPIHTSGITNLRDAFNKMDTILREKGIQYGEHEYKIADASTMVITDQNKATIIQKLLDADLGEEVWSQLTQTQPDLATKLANSKLNEARSSALSRFEEMIENDELSESDWQDFFEANTWIFGYGLRYQFLEILETQPHYGGMSVRGRGDQRGDFLAATEAETRFTCLVEIKKPTTQLLQSNSYRNGAWGISNELSGAISQIQINCSQWEITGSRTDENREAMQGIYTVSPKGIVVAGKLSQLNALEKRNSFERFRQELRNPEILTYDELLARAKFIVGNVVLQGEETDDDLPF